MSSIVSKFEVIGRKIKETLRDSSNGKGKRRHGRASSILATFGIMAENDEEEDAVLNQFLENNPNSNSLRMYHSMKGILRHDSEISSTKSIISADRDMKTELEFRQQFLRAIQGSKFFQHFSDEFFEDLYDRSVEISLTKGGILYDQNQIGSLLFVLVRGTIRLTKYRRVHKHEVSDIEAGTCLCEDALIESITHENEAVVTSETATVLAVHRMEFKDLNLWYAQVPNDEEDMSFLSRMCLLTSFPESQLEYISMKKEILDLELGSLVISWENYMDALYYISSGSVSVYRRNSKGESVKICDLGMGEHFGNCLHLHDRYTTGTETQVTATSPFTKLVKIEQSVYMDSFALDPCWNQKARVAFQRTLFFCYILDMNPMFSTLEDNIQIAGVVENMEIYQFHHGQIVDGTAGVFVILAGFLAVVNTSTNTSVTTLLEGECYGMFDESLMLDLNQNIVDTGSSWLIHTDSNVVTSNGFSLCGFITSDMIRSIHIDASEKKIPVEVKADETVIALAPIENVKKSDMELLCRIYSASFSRLYVAKHRPTGCVIAVKEIRQNVKYESTESFQRAVRNEIDILSALSSTNLVPQLIGSWVSNHPADPSLVLMEPLDGGDLETYLKTNGCLNYDSFVFYAASLMQILKHLSEKKVMHRDIKPRNLVLDGRGFLRLVDFGIAKVVNNYESRTFSTCGTPKFFAPEMAANSLGKGAGYTPAVDWWQAGVALFEMAYGYNLFFEFTAEQKDIIGVQPLIPLILEKIVHYCETYKTIQSDNPLFTCRPPNDLQSDDKWLKINSFILDLLQPDPFDRLGIRAPGPKLVKQNPIFCTIMWAAILNRTCTTPFMGDQFLLGSPFIDTSCSEEITLLTLPEAQLYSGVLRSRSSRSVLASPGDGICDLWKSKEAVYTEARNVFKQVQRFSSL